MIVMVTAQQYKGMAGRCLSMAPPARPRSGLTMGDLTKRFGSVALVACIVAVAATATAPAQQRTRPQQTPPKQSGPVTALVVMTPNGPATCATWVQWRAPAAHPADKAAIEYWVEGYLSGLAAGSKHDVIGQFRRDALAAWLDRYCTANPQTKLPAAVNALGLEMLAHPGDSYDGNVGVHWGSQARRSCRCSRIGTIRDGMRNRPTWQSWDGLHPGV